MLAHQFADYLIRPGTRVGKENAAIGTEQVK
jgi:hypothetical protein